MAGKAQNIRSYTRYIYGSGQPLGIMCSSLVHPNTLSAIYISYVVYIVHGSLRGGLMQCAHLQGYTTCYCSAWRFARRPDTVHSSAKLCCLLMQCMAICTRPDAVRSSARFYYLLLQCMAICAAA